MNAQSARNTVLGSAAIAILLVLFGAINTASAQTPDAFGRGWYIGPAAQATTVGGEAAVMSGFKVQWAPKGNLMLGLENYTLLNNIEAVQPSPDGEANVYFMYGGVSAAYGYAVNDRVNVAPKMLVGWAEAHWRDGFWDGVLDRKNRDANHTTSLVLEPGIGAEIGVTRWMNVMVGGSYRFAMAGKSHALRQADMSGPAATVGIRFGRLF